MSGSVGTVTQPRGQELHEPHSGRALVAVAAILVAAAAVPPLSGALVGWSGLDVLDGVAGLLVQLGYLAALFGISWLAPGVFVGIARRSAWTGVAVSVLLLVAQSLLLVAAAGAAGVPMEL